MDRRASRTIHGQAPNIATFHTDHARTTSTTNKMEIDALHPTQDPIPAMPHNTKPTLVEILGTSH